jgi:2-iminoacetate synthase ThiH
MFDINFYKNSFPIKKKITQGKLSLHEANNIEKELEILRNKTPTIFNIETTNYCNMKCVFCARTIYMERKNIWINDK